jgi:SAM-dependent methyltransferase
MICFACGGNLGDVLFAIPNLPLVDSFESTYDKALMVPRQDINLRQCEHCSTVQIDKLVDIKSIYTNYIYESSSSPDLLEHFSNYASKVASNFGNNLNVLEIGANDGILLKQLANLGFKNLVGIDPAPQVNKIELDNVILVNDFFNETSSFKLKKYFQKYDLIIANNCFSHIPNLREIFLQCSSLLSERGTIIIEVQSLLHLFEQCIFDYVYHEHIYYHSLTSLSKLLIETDLEIYNVELVQTKGGSYRIYISKKDKFIKSGSLEFWIYRESIVDIHDKKTWEKLNNYLIKLKHKLFSLLEKNKSIIGYGASATGTVLMSFFDIEKYISKIVDDNPKRQGRFSPGAGIPIIALSSIIDKSDYLILSWRHKDLILRKLNSKNSFMKIVPLPFLNEKE